MKGKNWKQTEKLDKKWSLLIEFLHCASTFRHLNNKFMTVKYNCAKLLYYNAIRHD